MVLESLRNSDFVIGLPQGCPFGPWPNFLPFRKKIYISFIKVINTFINVQLLIQHIKFLQKNKNKNTTYQILVVGPL